MGMGPGTRGLVVALMVVAGAAQAREVSNVQMPDAIALEGRQVALEHMELKRKLFFDIYVWGLYLEHKPASTREAIAFQGPKQLQLRFQRGLKRDQLADAFRVFLDRTTALRSAEMRRCSERLVQSLRGVSKGDSLVITYLPTTGLTVSGEGSQGAVIPGKQFADALFGAWLQENPIYEPD